LKVRSPRRTDPAQAHDEGPTVLDVDRQLLLLREIESRIAFVESYLLKQQALVDRLAGKNLRSASAQGLYQVMQESLSALEQRRNDLLHAMVLTPQPDEADTTSGEPGP
jgi:hypothetical protein